MFMTRLMYHLYLLSQWYGSCMWVGTRVESVIQGTLFLLHLFTQGPTSKYRPRVANISTGVIGYVVHTPESI